MLFMSALIFTSCSDDDDNNIINQEVLQGYENTRAAVDGVADFIDGPIGNLTEDLGEVTMANGGFSSVTVDSQARIAATNAVQAYEQTPTDENAVMASKAIEDLVVANRVAIVGDFQQILGDDFPSEQDLSALIASVENDLNKPSNLTPTQSAAFDIIIDVQINGAAIEALLNIANTKFELGLDIPSYNSPNLPSSSFSTQNLLETALNSVSAVGNLTIPSVEAIQNIVDELLMQEVLQGYEDTRAAVDGVANFIDGPIGDLTEDLGEFTGAQGGFTRVLVDAQVRTDATNAVEAYNANPTMDNAIMAANKIEDLVVANRVAIIGDFQQILGDDFPSDQDLAALITSVEDELGQPSNLSDTESAVFDIIVDVQINGAAIEALLNIANSKFQLGLDIPMYMNPSLPTMINESNLLETALNSVSAVEDLTVPSVQAIQDIVDQG